MNELVKKNIIFRLIYGLVLLLLTGLTVYFFIKTLEINTDNVYLINLIGIGGILFFTIVEMVLMFKNIKKTIIFHSVIFNEHDSSINWPAFVVANIGVVIGLTISIIASILYLTSSKADIYSSSMVLIPLGTFIYINGLIYDVHTYFYRSKKVKLKDLIK